MTPIKFSANTGFLWPHLPFIEKIHMAKKAGFAALEFHDEALNADHGAVQAALTATGLPVLSMNVRMGESMGCAALPDQVSTAQSDIDLALEVAAKLGVQKLHILSGKTRAKDAQKTYVGNLRYALAQGDIDILIEPISRAAAPDYFLNRLAQAEAVLQQVDSPRISLMFDCYHVLMEEGGLIAPFDAYQTKIGHIQIAARKNRADPDLSDPDYSTVLSHFLKAGYTGAFGCEYRQNDPCDTRLVWRDKVLADITGNSKSFSSNPVGKS